MVGELIWVWSWVFVGQCGYEVTWDGMGWGNVLVMMMESEWCGAI